MIKHNEMVMALAKDGEIIASEMTGDDAHLMHMAIGVSVGHYMDTYCARLCTTT